MRSAPLGTKQRDSEPAEAPPPAGRTIRLRAPLLVGVVLVGVGLLGWTSALVWHGASSSDGGWVVVGVLALGSVVAGLAAGGWTLSRSRRDGAERRVSARRLNRFHAVMSQSNRLILRRPDPGELFEGVCEVCVRAGRVDLAVVDLSNLGEVHRSVSGHPAPGSVAPTGQELLDGARTQALLMTLAMRSGECAVVDDVLLDQRMSEARSWCVANAVRALAAIPLKRDGTPVGALLLYSTAEGFFDAGVRVLLSELGADLSFALDNADRERERRAAMNSDRNRITAEIANRAKTEFLTQMSHELRTPLNAMLGFAQLLATDRVQVLSPGQAERVRLITQGGWHLLGLVNDVMDISRIEAGRFEVVIVGGDISPVLDEAVALTRPLARTHRVELAEREATRDGIGALADPRRLHQVLLNLLSNACKYNRPGGRVRVGVVRSGAEVFIDVVDNGVGMTDDQLAHLFEPFNRLGNEGDAIEGSGIGLTLTRRLVEMMNGRLEISSSTAAGTRARVVLPSCAIPVNEISKRTSGTHPTPAGAGDAVVLYIEDDPVNRILVEQMLSRCRGVSLLQAENGADGIAMAQRRRPDLILLDMQLPDMTGLDVLAALGADARTDAVPVVAVSANAMAADVAMALEMGAVDYWTKPLMLESFVAGVSARLSRGSAIATRPAEA